MTLQRGTTPRSAYAKPIRSLREACARRAATALLDVPALKVVLSEIHEQTDDIAPRIALACRRLLRALDERELVALHRADCDLLLTWTAA